jgi:hypothetical protein
MARGKIKETEKKKPAAKNGNGANLGFEAQLFLAADKFRGNLEPSDYKHVALGLIFLKYISDAFEAKRAALHAEDPATAEDPDEHLAENVFWVPKDARWSHLQAKAKQPTIGKLIDDAMLAIESKNTSLKGVLPKDYNRPALNKVMLGELIDLVSGIAMHEEGEKAKDTLPYTGDRGWPLVRFRIGNAARRIFTRSKTCSGSWWKKVKFQVLRHTRPTLRAPRGDPHQPAACPRQSAQWREPRPFFAVCVSAS